RSFRPNAVLRILSSFTKGMKDTAAPAPAVAPAQAAAQPEEFEEASVKQCDPDNLPSQPDGARGGGANSFLLTPGRLRGLCLTVATLVRTAYHYSPLELDFLSDSRAQLNLGSVYGLGQEDGRRIRGGPDWIKSERYTIEAVAGRGASPDARTMSGPMLQRLLERRFGLRAHVEIEQAPAFSLTVARSG